MRRTIEEENSFFDIEEAMDIEDYNSTNDIIGEPLHFINNNNTIFFEFYIKINKFFL